MTQLPEEIYAEIVEMIKMGYGVDEIVEITGWSKGVIAKIRREANVLKTSMRCLLGVDVDGVVEWYAKGKTIKETCAEFDINRHTLYAALTATGTPMRKYDTFRNEVVERRFDEAMEMYKKGYFLWQIFNETGVAASQMSRELHKRGIPLRRQFRGKGNK